MVNVSNIAGRFILTRDKINDIARNWKLNIADHKILEIFNFSLPCNEECPINLAEPREFILDVERDIVNIVFDVKAVKLGVDLLKADPFIFFSRENNGTNVCLVVYKGPNSVMYDSKTDCVIPLPATTDLHNNLALAPNFETCGAIKLNCEIPEIKRLPR
jgi:hypothetical protein